MLIEAAHTDAQGSCGVALETEKSEGISTLLLSLSDIHPGCATRPEKILRNTAYYFVVPELSDPSGLLWDQIAISMKRANRIPALCTNKKDRSEHAAEKI